LIDVEELRKAEFVEVDGSSYSLMSSAYINEFVVTDRKYPALKLLGDLCSLSLDPRDTKNPLKPGAVSVGSFDCNLALFKQWLPDVRTPSLKARIADLLWLKRQGKGYAEVAIDAYTSTPIDVQSWRRGTNHCWDRALSLSISINCECRRDEIVATMFHAFNRHITSQPMFASSFAKLLTHHKLLGDRADQVASSLENAISSLLANKHFHKARVCLGALGELRQGQKNLGGQNWAKWQIADSFALEASEPNSWSIKSARLRKALHLMKLLPNAFREQEGRQSRLETLERELSNLRPSLDDVTSIHSNLGIAGASTDLLRTVAGKNPIEALLLIARLPAISHSRAHQQALDRLDGFTLNSIMPTSVIDGSGRLISRLGAWDGGRDESNERVHATMLAVFREHVVICINRAKAALQQTCRQDNVDLAIFERLVRDSHVFPEDRVKLVARGLYAGYCEDYVLSTHLLAFQVEHWVRTELWDAGNSTVTRSESTENEVGLSALIQKAKEQKALDDDLLLELEAIFAHKDGANLRNEIAHGLMDEDSFETPETVYAWLLCLRLVLEGVVRNISQDV
jgi:hypothetical protein